MRILITSLLTLWTILECASQTDVTKSFADKFDFSKFLATNKEYGFDGVYGDTYQRIQFAFTKILKSSGDKLVYNITGADRLKKNVTRFNGEIRLTTIIKHEGSFYNPEKPGKDKWIEFKGEFEFREDTNAKGSGIFKGILSFALTLQDNKFIDDMAEYQGDGFSNFIYQGQWTSYLTGKTKKCIWGQGGLPNTGDFNQGDGSLSVNEKYKKNGWEMDDMNLKLLDNPKYWWRQ
jgi:hypothetical protein